MSEHSEPTLRDLLRDLAGADAPELVEEARAGARARAKAMLENALVDELLAAAAATRRAGGRDADEGVSPDIPAPDSEPSGAPASSDSREGGDAWWAYCVVSAAQAEAASGLEGIEPGTRVEAVEEGELAALVSRVPLAEYDDERLRQHLEDIEWLERTARGHEAVLEGVLTRTSIVPLRLCTLYHDRDGVRRMLRESAASLGGSLTAVDGSDEWGVKVFAEGAPAPAEVSPESREEARPPVTGAGYLASRQRERRAAQDRDQLCQECVEDVHGEMSRVARQAHLNPVQRPEAHGRAGEMLLNGAYLVDRDRVNEISTSVELLQDRWSPRGFAVELTGPWPPYNFVSESAGMIS